MYIHIIIHQNPQMDSPLFDAFQKNGGGELGGGPEGHRGDEAEGERGAREPGTSPELQPGEKNGFGNVVKTIINQPPNQHRWYKFYINHSQSWTVF